LVVVVEQDIEMQGEQEVREVEVLDNTAELIMR
jgi:hypothetical protein